MAENFTKLMTDTKAQIQEAQTTPSRKIPKKEKKKSIPRCTIFKMQKNKEKILKEARGKK